MDGKDPWPEHRCSRSASPPALVAEFDSILADAEDERPLQTFFAGHPQILTCLLPPGHDAWVFDKSRLGGEFIPDFLLCTRNSLGFEWVAVELESPTRPPLLVSGRPSAKLNEGLGQIRDWRGWLRQNIAYAQSTLKYTDLNAECRGAVIIGRRSAIEQSRVSQYRELSDELTSVMTYDRLRDCMVDGTNVDGGRSGKSRDC